MLNKAKSFLIIFFSFLLCATFGACSSYSPSNESKLALPSSNVLSSQANESSDHRIAIKWELVPGDLHDTAETARLNLTIKNQSSTFINGIAIKMGLRDDVNFEPAEPFLTFDKKDGYMIIFDDQKFDPDVNMGLSINIKANKSGNYTIPFLFYEIVPDEPLKGTNGDNALVKISFNVAKDISKPSFS